MMKREIMNIVKFLVWVVGENIYIIKIKKLILLIVDIGGKYFK